MTCKGEEACNKDFKLYNCKLTKVLLNLNALNSKKFTSPKTSLHVRAYT